MPTLKQILEVVQGWLTVLTKSTTLESFIASVEFFTRACVFHLPSGSCTVKVEKKYSEVQKVK